MTYATQAKQGTDLDRRRFITLDQLPDVITMCAAQRQPLCIHGHVGSGKTSKVWQTLAKLNLTGQLVLTSTKESVEFNGIPHANRNTDDILVTEYAMPAFVLRAQKMAAQAALNNKPHVIVWDELNRASDASVLNVASQAILTPFIGDHPVDNLWHIAMVNDAEHSTGVMALPDQLRNRFVHVYIVDGAALAPAWLVWARTAGIHPACIAYITNCPEHIHMPDRKADAFPTLRAWEFMSRIAHESDAKAAAGARPCYDVEAAMFYGAIGAPVGEQFVAHLHLYRNMAGKFDVNDIFANPTTANLPTGISEQYAVADALSRFMTVANANAAVIYLRRMTEEFQTCAILAALRRTAQSGQASPNDRTVVDFARRDTQWQTRSPLYASAQINKWIVDHEDLF